MPDIAPAATAVKSGWKTTEAYLTVAGLGVLAYLGQQLMAILPQIAATPGLPAWAAPILGLAVPAIAWIMKIIVGEYTAKRTELKIEALPDPMVAAAVAAGAAAAKDPAPIANAP